MSGETGRAPLARASGRKAGGWWTLVIATGVGTALWAASAPLTGYQEPWDAPAAYYFVGLPGLALLIGLFSRQGVLFTILQAWGGLFVGQCSYVMAFLPRGPFAAVGLLALVVFSLIAGLASGLGAYLGHRGSER